MTPKQRAMQAIAVVLDEADHFRAMPRLGKPSVAEQTLDRLVTDLPYHAESLVAYLASPSPEPLDVDVRECPDCNGAGWVAEATADADEDGQPGEPYQYQRVCSHAALWLRLASPSPEPLNPPREFAERAEALVRAGTPDDAIVPLALTSIALSLAASLGGLLMKKAPATPPVWLNSDEARGWEQGWNAAIAAASPATGEGLHGDGDECTGPGDSR